MLSLCIFGPIHLCLWSVQRFLDNLIDFRLLAVLKELREHDHSEVLSDDIFGIDTS